MAEAALLGGAEVARLVPHADRMCLVDRVVAWDAGRIRCEADGHRAGDHPLRTGTGLAALHAIEYAAQAMAVHGALLAGAGGRPGMLASVRRVRWHVVRLDTVPAPLVIDAEQLLAEPGGIVYRFRVGAGGASLVEGDAMVVFPQSP